MTCENSLEKEDNLKKRTFIEELNTELEELARTQR